MTRAVSRDSTRCHFAPLGHELRDRSNILIINLKRSVGAKPTYLAAKHRPPPWRSLLIVPAFPGPSRSFPSILCHIYNTSIRVNPCNDCLGRSMTPWTRLRGVHPESHQRLEIMTSMNFAWITRHSLPGNSAARDLCNRSAQVCGSFLAFGSSAGRLSATGAARVADGLAGGSACSSARMVMYRKIPSVSLRLRSNS
jgi:hypothetical protein